MEETLRELYEYLGYSDEHINVILKQRKKNQEQNKKFCLKYMEEQMEDILYKSFYEDTKEHWSQREQPSIRDFIKWLIIKSRENGRIFERGD